MVSVSQRLLESLKEHGANFFVTVPCKLSADLVSLISRDKEIMLPPAKRKALASARVPTLQGRCR